MKKEEQHQSSCLIDPRLTRQEGPRDEACGNLDWSCSLSHSLLEMVKHALGLPILLKIGQGSKELVFWK
jgi:hypothetical protein